MPGTIFHADRGTEYTSTACIAACQRLGLRRSMSRTASCLDNAVAELVRLPKVELVNRQHYRTRAEARTAILRWIVWYNRCRLHSANGYLSPVEWEQQLITISPLPSTTAADLRCPPPGGRSKPPTRSSGRQGYGSASANASPQPGDRAF
jgi:putative transposase